MNIPFTVEQFFGIFADYNAQIWPVQVIAYAIGLAAAGALCASPRRNKRFIFAVLAALWAWNGIAYQYMFFAAINPAARLFGALFVLQSALFAAAALNGKVHFRTPALDVRTLMAAALIVYAFVVYELVGYLAGHGLMGGPLFGVALCPTTIFTIGVLLMARGRNVIWLSVIPVLWALVGTSAAVVLGVPQDLGLAVSALALTSALALDYASAKA